MKIGGDAMNKICDIHTHIVPGVDDGATNLKMSIQMLRDAYSQGIRSIVCSSHSWGCRENYFKNLEILEKQVEKENIDINLYSGCEIYCNYNSVTDITWELYNGILPTINETEYVLVEFDPNATTNEIADCIRYINNYNYNVILAHTERYSSLFREHNWIAFLQEIGCLFQINAYSLQNERNINIKSAARDLLKEELVSFIGSDAHSISHRPYMIQSGIDYIYQNCGNEYVQDILYRNAERILNINE